MEALNDANETLIIIKYPGNVSCFKFISMGKNNEEICIERVCKQYQFWHVNDINVYGYIKCSDSNAMEQYMSSKIMKSDPTYGTISRNGWMYVTSEALINFLKKIHTHKEMENSRAFVITSLRKKKHPQAQPTPAANGAAVYNTSDDDAEDDTAAAGGETLKQFRQVNLVKKK